ncbi:GTPase [Williamsia phyllosphaerae]|uniref:Isoniazid-induced protein IniC n=1 Tax=Williamsia phyllosphaerae TaxID=885042 RepID=A0ABQ1U0L9_9NOCA|nr:GTPase [Williamsia phyllosphaerae]GGF08235.1 isoniazid-induced protein IniC [Williamsia phyllosphaerae]
MSGMMSDPVHVVLDHGLRSLASLGGDLVGHANSIGASLWAPPRLVVVGRLKAGKSTLVNALIGAPVAETAALEATRVVAVYQDGAPSRAEVVALDGTRHPVPVVPGRTSTLPIPDEQIAYLHRWLPSAAIRDLTFVDTPGLATLTAKNEAATRRVLIDGFEQTRTASVDADAAVFLFDSTPRADELEFLKQLPLSPLNTLGVLSRADSFGEGALGRRDPLQHAAEHAVHMSRELAQTVSRVVPISGLMAQTSHTGALGEGDARALASLAGMAPLDLIDALESDGPGPLAPAVRDRLLDLVGEYGVLNGRQVATRGAAALNEWLAANSGIAALQQVLRTSLSEFAVLNRARRVLDRVDQLAYTHPAREPIRSIAYAMRSEPAMLRVGLLGDLQRLLVADPRSPVVDELRTLLTGRGPAACVGLPPDASVDHVRAHARQRLATAQGRASATMTAAEDAALVDVIRAYTSLMTTGHL